jgi:hypothetical protein
LTLNKKMFLLLKLDLSTLTVYFGIQTIIEKVAWNKSSLLLEIQKLNTQTLQLFMKIIKTESIYKSN